MIPKYSLPGTIFVVSFVLIVCLLNPHMWHWSLIPIFGCGVLIGRYAFAWASGRLQLLDPAGVVGVFGFYYFFLAPLIIVWTQYSLPYVGNNPDDFRPYVGILSMLNLIGILAFDVIINSFGSRQVKLKTIVVPKERTRNVYYAAMACSICAFIYCVIIYGGVRSLFLFNFERSYVSGSSLMMVLANALPLIIFFYLADNFYKGGYVLQKYPYWVVFFVFGLQALVGGYIVSRGQIIFSAVWVLVFVFFKVKTVSAKKVAMILLISLPILYGAGFYKALGPSAIDILSAGGSFVDNWSSLVTESNRTLLGALAGDASRSSIQSYTVYQMTDGVTGGYQCWYGKTYFQSFYSSIPLWLWENKPFLSGKIGASTLLMWGTTHNLSLVFFSSHAYGIAGEAMLNFGIYAIPFAYMVFAFFVAWVRRYYISMVANDFRWAIYPFFLWWCVNLLLWDSDNLVSHTISRALIPLLVFLSATKRVTTNESREANHLI